MKKKEEWIKRWKDKFPTVVKISGKPDSFAIFRSDKEEKRMIAFIRNEREQLKTEVIRVIESYMMTESTPSEEYVCARLRLVKEGVERLK